MSNDLYESYCYLRDMRGEKDAQVAKATGIGKSTFSDWKSGRSIPKADKLQKIADYFGVTVDYLRGKDTAPAPDLSEDEAELLRLFRMFNESGRSRALCALKELSEIPRYTDKSKESSISGTA